MTPLRQRLLDDLQLRRRARNTQEAYLRAVARLARFFHRSPDQITPEEVRSFLLDLMQKHKASPSLFNQTRCALVFFYRVSLGRDFVLERILCQSYAKKLPTVLSPAEVVRFFQATRNLRQRALFLTIYAAGLRVSEVIHLEAKDIDSQRLVVPIRLGKGQKDRLVMLSAKLLTVLRDYWKTYRPTAKLFFPGKNRQRPLDHKNIWLACGLIARRAGITKNVTPHTFRHSFATHLLETGVDIRTIQALLGHRSLRTTVLYTFVSPARVSATQSPLDPLDLEGKANPEGKAQP